MAEQAPKWLSAPELRAWLALIDVTTGVMATLDIELQAEHGLSIGDYEVLARLSEAPEHSVRMTDLAGPPEAVAERHHAPDRRARPRRLGRAPAVPVGSPRLERGPDGEGLAPPAGSGAHARARGAGAFRRPAQ